MSSNKSLNTVIITGGNSGLGYQCARELALTHAWQIVLACRNQQKADEAVASLIAETAHQEITALELDLTSLSAVREFVAKFSNKNFAPLKAIIANAGIQIVSGRTYTKDGFETTFAVNHLGHFLLINLLLKYLQPPARIVLVSSGTHDPAQKTGLPPPQLLAAQALAQPDKYQAKNGENAGTIGRAAYSTSKLCNVLCTYELARRLAKQGKGSITVNAFDPGLMPGTGLARDYSKLEQFGWNYLLPILRLFMRNVNSTAASGKALARLITDPTLAAVTGKYFEGMREIASSKESYDEAKAAELWTGSAELVQLTEEEMR